MGVTGAAVGARVGALVGGATQTKIQGKTLSYPSCNYLTQVKKMPAKCLLEASMTRVTA